MNVYGYYITGNDEIGFQVKASKADDELLGTFAYRHNAQLFLYALRRRDDENNVWIDQIKTLEESGFTYEQAHSILQAIGVKK